MEKYVDFSFFRGGAASNTGSSPSGRVLQVPDHPPVSDEQNLRQLIQKAVREIYYIATK